MMIRLDNIQKKFDGFAIDDISFEVAEGDYFVLLGESGAGKTLILEMIAGLTAPDAGAIMVNGKEITSDPIQHRGVGLVYQDQTLFPHLSVRQNIEYPLRCRRVKKAAAAHQAQVLAEQIGIGHLQDRVPATLSIGEAQRTALARTLVTQPRILLLDEPLASLDVRTKSRMRALLRRIKASGQTIIHVTHDYKEALALADKVAVLENGTLSQTGEPAEVFRHPASKFVADFVGIKNYYQGVNQSGTFETGSVHFHTSGGDGAGRLLIDPEKIAVSFSGPLAASANVFEGTVVDMEPVSLGVELHVDVGVPLVAALPHRAMPDPLTAVGDQVWIGFDADAATFISGEPSHA